MTPAQLRAYSAVVRTGSVHSAAAELGMSDAGVSMHIAHLRKELDDPLFTRTAGRLSFTPGGLLLASRAVEILGLQQQTAIEVTEAARGRRLLRIAASTMFAEHAAPGVIELFSSRADDLAVELSVHPTSRFRDLIASRNVDIALGPPVEGDTSMLAVRPFLRYQMLTVASASSPLAGGSATLSMLRDQPWMLGPAAGSVDGEIAKLLAQLEIPDERQRIFPSDAAALDEAQRVGGLTLMPGFAVARHLRSGRVVAVKGTHLQHSGEWCATTLPASARQPVVNELLNFITTPRCTQAMIKGSGVGVARFRPKIHVTLWS